MSSVIIQARDWSDWYVIRDWLNANAPGEWQHRSVQDNVPAAFEYPQRYQAGLMAALYPEALPAAPTAPAVSVPPVPELRSSVPDPVPSLTPQPSSAPSAPGGDAGTRHAVSRHTSAAVGETTEVIVTSAPDAGEAGEVVAEAVAEAASPRSDRRRGSRGSGSRS